MKTITRNIETVSPKGNKRNFTVVATRGWEDVTKHDSEDGIDLSTKQVVNTTTVTFALQGKTVKSAAWDIITKVPAKYAQLGVVAILGKKVALYADDYKALTNAINEAKAEAETDESWMAYEAARKEAAESEAKYAEHVEMMNKAMNY